MPYVWLLYCLFCLPPTASKPVFLHVPEPYKKSGEYKKLRHLLALEGYTLLSQQTQTPHTTTLHLQNTTTLLIQKGPWIRAFHLPQKLKTPTVRARAMVVYLELFADWVEQKPSPHPVQTNALSPQQAALFAPSVRAWTLTPERTPKRPSPRASHPQRAPKYFSEILKKRTRKRRILSVRKRPLIRRPQINTNTNSPPSKQTNPDSNTNTNSPSFKQKDLSAEKEPILAKRPLNRILRENRLTTDTSTDTPPQPTARPKERSLEKETPPKKRPTETETSPKKKLALVAPPIPRVIPRGPLNPNRSLASKRRWFHVTLGVIPEVLVTGFQRADFGMPVFVGVGLGDWSLYVGLRSHLYTLQTGRVIGLFRPSFLLGWSPLLPWKLGAFPLRIEILAGAIMDFQVVDRGEQKYALVSGWGFALGARLRLELAAWFTLSLDISVHYLPPFGFSPTDTGVDAPHLVQMPIGLGALFTF